MPDRTIGNYVLGPLLGRGGMSEVYAAEHRFLGDRVAVKLLRSHLAGDPGAIAAFTAEATRTRAIDHPGVVRVIDFGSDGDDCYLVMERLDGESLAARLERERRLGEAELRRLGAAIADGVAAAHDRGIVHRDLKPGNIMLAGDAVKIVDFGIARTFARGVASVTSSRIGSIGYMAPEQITEGLVAPCIDVWALGVILYEAASGQLPFADFTNGRTPQLFEQALPLGTIAPVSPALEALVMSCLARAPARRPVGMREVAAQLRDATDPRFTEPLAPAIESRGNARAASQHTEPITPEVRPDVPDEVRPGVRPEATPEIVTLRISRTRGRTWAIAGLVAVIAIAVAWMIIPRRSVLPERVAAAPPAVVAPPIVEARAPVEMPAPERVAAIDPPTAEPPAGFRVDVRSAPSGAAVHVGGKRVGVTPATIVLDGPASIVVTRAGYRPSRVLAKDAGPITVRLVRAPRPRRPVPVAGETLD